MLTYYVVDDLRTAEARSGDAYTLLDRAVRAVFPAPFLPTSPNMPFPIEKVTLSKAALFP